MRPSVVAVPDASRRHWLLFEMGILFLAAPILMRSAVYDYGVPLFYALPPVLIAMMVFLFADRSFALKRELLHLVSLETLYSIAVLFVSGAAVVIYFMAREMPDELFSLAAERPGKWLAITALYPFTSVLAQELVYRVFFFHRYGPLFPNRWVLIGTNALAFGFGHILFRNWVAVGATVLGGLLFAWRYERTRSFWAVWIEHTLWGWLMFTVGLGIYFYTGVANPTL